MIELLKSKIINIKVMNTDLYSEGSITIYKDIMDAAGIFEYEKIFIVDMENANRFESYVIKGEDSINPICVNGEAACLVNIGDRLSITAYEIVPDYMHSFHQPKIVLLNENNNIKSKSSAEQYKFNI